MSQVDRDARAQVLREERAQRKRVPSLPDETISTLHAVKAKEEATAGTASPALTTQRVARAMELQDGKAPNWLAGMLQKVRRG